MSFKIKYRVSQKLDHIFKVRYYLYYANSLFTCQSCFPTCRNLGKRKKLFTE